MRPENEAASKGASSAEFGTESTSEQGASYDDETDWNSPEFLALDVEERAKIIAAAASSRGVESVGEMMSIVRRAQGANYDPGWHKATRTGRMELFDTSACPDAGNPMCFGQNYSEVRLIVRWDDEAGADAAMSPFVLRDDEAVVVYGRIPPRCRYFGISPYVLTSGECSVFASASDTVNQFTLGAHPGAGGDVHGADAFGDEVYGKPFAAVFGHNLAVGEAIVKQILTVPSDVMPAQCIFCPVRRRDNVTYTLVARVNRLEDAAAGAAFLADPQMKVAIMSAPRYAAGPYQTSSVFRPRATSVSEIQLAPNLERYAEFKIGEIMRRAGLHSLSRVHVYDFLSEIGYDNGDDCIDKSMNCMGDNRDATHRLADFTNFADGDVGVVVGVNHVQTGKALFTTLSLSNGDTGFEHHSVTETNASPDFVIFVFFKPTRTASADARRSAIELVIENLFSSGIHPSSVYAVPENVSNITISERAYIQFGSGGSERVGVSAAPDTLLPFMAFRGRLGRAASGGQNSRVQPLKPKRAAPKRF